MKLLNLVLIVVLLSAAIFGAVAGVAILQVVDA